MKIDKFIGIVNIPYIIANHVVGERHTIVHRRIVGALIMLIGVGVAHAANHLSNILISLVGDLVGYSIHGTGLIPFIHGLENTSQQQQNQRTEQKQDCETCLN